MVSGVPKSRRGNINARQKMAVDNILSGKFPSLRAAMVDAGYSPKSAINPQQVLLRTVGVQNYIKTLDKKSRRKYNMTLQERFMDIANECLLANKVIAKEKVHGKLVIREYPDWKARHSFVRLFSEFFGWTATAGTGPARGGATQYNFFMVKEDKREAFNNKFKDFLKGFYEDGR